LYVGAETSDYTEAVGARWLLSGVARIFRPGCKADCCLILEGKQGIGKSRTMATLAGPWYADEIAELGSKDAALQTRGVWIVEISELDSLSRSEVSKVKAFLSRTTDRFRPPYGRRVIESPRQCIFGGTVNHSAYLRDETGGRRFWPVACERIQIDALARDRDQLWAEAVVRYRAGVPWWLDSLELNRQAAIEQSDRYDADPWQNLIAAWVESKSTTSVEEILERCVQKPTGQWGQQDMNRVARCLRALGWERYREREGRVLRWRYRRAEA
jgi:predicted P-loop ATPase